MQRAGGPRSGCTASWRAGSTSAGWRAFVSVSDEANVATAFVVSRDDD